MALTLVGGLLAPAKQVATATGAARKFDFTKLSRSYQCGGLSQSRLLCCVLSKCRHEIRPPHPHHFTELLCSETVAYGVVSTNLIPAAMRECDGSAAATANKLYLDFCRLIRCKVDSLPLKDEA